MGLLSLLGLGSSQLKYALRNGAIIVDVRTGLEYDQGHVPGALNIPADRISSSAERLKSMNRPVVLCCNSGSRAAIALQHFKAKGLTEVYNGGNWQRLLKLIHRL
jgi:phage shock protein E